MSNDTKFGIAIIAFVVLMTAAIICACIQMDAANGVSVSQSLKSAGF